MSPCATPLNRIKFIIYCVVLCAFTFLPSPDITAQSRSASDSKSSTAKKQSTTSANKTDGQKTTSKTSTKTKSRSGSSKSSKTSKIAPTPQQPTAADTPIEPQTFNEALLSGLVFDLTNIERRRAGLPEFKNNQNLYASATGHSRDMAARNYFEHKSKGFFRGTAPSDRIKATGYAPSMSAENIAMIPIVNSQRIQSWPGQPPQVIERDVNSYNRMAAYSVTQWMQSPGHRKNILNPDLKEMGVGVAVGVKDNIPYVYLTQNFGG